ncbi:DUF4222 domain-containing protein [Buttiauxella sp. B2]|uniref:DUF4222 domain-containing protein n=1 Tax=Buttiauxella sp. B2 TaxID=2587812 RepID=UPI00351A2B7F
MMRRMLMLQPQLLMWSITIPVVMSPMGQQRFCTDLEMGMNRLQDRFRSVLQRDTRAHVPAASESNPLPGQCYQNHYGHVVKVHAVTIKAVMYMLEGYGEICELSREQFKRKFAEVRE